MYSGFFSLFRGSLKMTLDIDSVHFFPLRVCRVCKLHGFFVLYSCSSTKKGIVRAKVSSIAVLNFRVGGVRFFEVGSSSLYFVEPLWPLYLPCIGHEQLCDRLPSLTKENKENIVVT